MTLCILVCIYTSILISQEIPESIDIALLKQQISQSKGLQKLILLDSLAHNIMLVSSESDFEKISRQTIDLAIALDSLGWASEHLADLMYRKNNIISIPQDGIRLYKEYKPKLNTFKSPKWDAELHIELADSYFFSGIIDSAFIYYDKAKTYAIDYDDDEFLAYTNLNMGSAYSSAGAFSEASQSLKGAYTSYLKIKDTFGLVHSKYLLATIYSKNDFLDEAEKERLEGIKLAEHVKDNGKLTSFYSDAARDAQKRGLEKERISYLKTAVYYNKISEFDVNHRITKLASLAIAYSQNDSIDAAQEIIKSIEKLPESLTEGKRVYYLNALKYQAFAQEDYKSALHYGKESLQINEGKDFYEPKTMALLFLSKVYTALGNDKEALSHYKSYTHIKDSITGIQKSKALAYYQTLYETEKRDQKIVAQNANIELLNSQSKIRTQWFIIIGIVALLGFLIFYLVSKFNQKIAKQKAVEELRTKISADLHDDVGSLLTGLAMQSEILGKNAPENIAIKLDRVSELSRSAMLKMRDAVWVMDARKDNWQSLVDRINEFASENLGAKELAYILNHENSSNQEEIAGATRQHLYLILKEAIANILKHSSADRVAIEMSKKKTEIVMSIKDNGKVTHQGTAGLGVSNIKKRVEELNGQLDIFTNDGYQVAIKIPA